MWVPTISVVGSAMLKAVVEEKQTSEGGHEKLEWRNSGKSCVCVCVRVTTDVDALFTATSTSNFFQMAHRLCSVVEKGE